MTKLNSGKIVFAVSEYALKNKDAKTSAVSMVRNGIYTCVVVKNGRIISAESPKGIAHIIGLHNKKMLKGTFVADTIIGKAAAIIFASSGVKACYGKTVSKSALEWLENRKIPVTYDICADYIINRKGDGICPMELTVKDIDNPSVALQMLKSKVEELKNSSVT